jgi:flagellin-like protein
MRLKELLTERDDAVSPVIGVILMVAITVILAAVIASFVLGLGPGGAAPTVNFDSSFDGSSTLTIEVTGGDSVPAGQLSVDDGSSTTQWDNFATGSPSSPDSEVSAGDSVEVTGLSSDYEVSVIWTSEDGGTTQTLTTFEG